ncbi:MAG TPA: TIGR03619 family F420-dependent LLM class oxidoreductase [Intrasporangium sp.]|nr:TIGR03619 family F420-dependent LLM class oxidoreductase [Intrasporangium sp.]
MDLGFALPVSGAWSSAESVRLVARGAEALGYSSLWTFQRLLHPAQGDWGATYVSVHDPVVTLAHAAALTQRVRLGVAVLNAPFVPPIVLAKQLTTLDTLSDGRLDVGLGLGWAAEEFEAVGVPRSERVGRTVETVECLRAIWGPDPVRFHGRYVHVPEAIVQPKPVQQPHPPLLMGGSAPVALERIGRLADGWVTSSRQDLRRVGQDIETVHAAAERAGRDPGALRFVVRGVVRLGSVSKGRDGRRRLLTGSVDQVHRDLEMLGEQGVTEVFVDPNFSPDVVSPTAEPARSLGVALELLEQLAPSTRPSG